jgi:uncharacterized protein
MNSPHTMTQPQPQIVVADSFIRRARGLMFRKLIGPDEMMYFPRCSCVHTIGMRIPIDIVFLNKKGFILRICVAVPPVQIRQYRGAYGVLEMAMGGAKNRNFEIHMKVI